MKNRLSRRQFLRFGTLATASAAVSLGFLGCGNALIQKVPGFRPDPPYEFTPSPNSLLDLPEGFTAHAFSRTGRADGMMASGYRADMMAWQRSLVPTVKPSWSGITNWSRLPKTSDPLDGINEKIERAVVDKLYDAGSGELPCIGGTTTLVYDTRTQTLEKHFLSLTGTIRNCAGGLTPWNTWITCGRNHAERQRRRTKPSMGIILRCRLLLTSD